MEIVWEELDFYFWHLQPFTCHRRLGWRGGILEVSSKRAVSILPHHFRVETLREHF